MENKKIKCRDCGIEFDFTVGEQKFFAEKGFSDPVRCKDCIELKKKSYSALNNKDNYFKSLYEKFKRNTVRF